jgi:uncharacterized protein YbaA (DUF1428 family)
MAHDVDGFVIPLRKDKIDEYRSIAEKAGQVLRNHCALEYRECIGDDLNVKGQVPFSQLIDSNPQKFTSTRLALQGAGAPMPTRLLVALGRQ